jgi:hypothetical protein
LTLFNSQIENTSFIHNNSIQQPFVQPTRQNTFSTQSSPTNDNCFNHNTTPINHCNDTTSRSINDNNNNNENYSTSSSIDKKMTIVEANNKPLTTNINTNNNLNNKSYTTSPIRSPISTNNSFQYVPASSSLNYVEQLNILNKKTLNSSDQNENENDRISVNYSIPQMNSYCLNGLSYKLKHNDADSVSNVSLSLSSSSSSSSPASTSSSSSSSFGSMASFVLTERDQTEIDSVCEAYKQAIQLVHVNNLPSNAVDMNVRINVYEVSVRRIIFFFKLIHDFRSLSHDLMVTLLKFNMMSILQIHSVNSFNLKENTFKEPDTNDNPLKADSLIHIYGEDVYNVSIGITTNLYEICRPDMTLIKLLMLVTLFDPLNEQLTNNEKKCIGVLQTKYISLLYLLMRERFGSPRAEIKLKEIIFEMSKVNELSRWFEKTVIEQSNVKCVRPLMKEVFSFPFQTDNDANNKNSQNSPNKLEQSKNNNNNEKGT